MKKTPLLVAFALSIALPLIPTLALEGAVVSISCPSIVLTGSEFYADVTVSNLSDFNSADYTVHYNASLFELEGVFSGSIDGTEIPLNYSSNSSSGVCRIVQHVDLQAISGSGYLSRIKFMCVGDGQSYLGIDGNLSDIYGTSMDSIWVGKSLESAPTILKVEAPDTAGGNLNASIVLYNVTAFSSINMTLHYDGSILYLNDVGNGYMGGSIVNVSWHDDGGEVKIVGLIAGGKSGSGCMANMTFTPVNTGLSYLNISDVTISNVSSHQIVAFIENKSIVIESSEQSPPVAAFSFLPEHPRDIDSINFNASTSYDIDGFITNWTWDFGDGSAEYGESASHMYEDNGTYMVELTVIDNDGLTGSIARNITVENVRPTADFTYYPENPSVNNEISFTDMSSDDDGDIVNFTWDFGDGNMSYEQNPGHTYADDGQYNVTLIVTDNDGGMNSTLKEITVSANNPPNEPSDPSPYNGEADVKINSVLSWQCSDIDEDTLKYDVYFGTSSSPPKMKSNQTEASYSPSMSFQTTYYWRVVAWDSHGAKTVGPTWYFITKANIPPSKPMVSGPSSGYTGSSLTFYASSTDQDGNRIRYGFDWNNDGIVDGWTNYYSPGAAGGLSHSWNSEGTYGIRVRAEDEYGAESGWSDLKYVNIQTYIPPPPPPAPPTADFSFSIVNITVFFKDESSDSDGYIVNRTWDFGDGNMSYEQNPGHTYADDGNYTVKLVVIDNDGLKDESEKNVVLQSPPPTKKPDLTVKTISISPSPPYEGDRITFSITVSNEGDGNSSNATIRYVLDGRVLNSSHLGKIEAGKSVTVAFSINASGGDHEFKTVIEYEGKEAVKSMDFTVNESGGFQLWIAGLLIAAVAAILVYAAFKKMKK